jgi:hypothetical protein
VSSTGGTSGPTFESTGGVPPEVPNGGTALLATLAMTQFMVVLDFTIVNVALPSIQHGLHVASTTPQWLVSAYAVTFGGFLLPPSPSSACSRRASCRAARRSRSCCDSSTSSRATPADFRDAVAEPPGAIRVDSELDLAIAVPRAVLDA